MRAVIQRVKRASIEINGSIFSAINRGSLVLLGISNIDIDQDMEYILDKIINLRIFSDINGKMNNDIASIDGEILIVSQFTLFGDARKGRRPSYSNAEKGEKAEKIYNSFIIRLKDKYNPVKIKSGKFGAMMDISLINDGPVTILLDSEKKF